MIKALMISTDAKVLEEGSAVRARMRGYGKQFAELHIIVFTAKNSRAIAEKLALAENVFAYPTASISKIFYVGDAIRIGTEIVVANGLNEKNSVITAQDPFETGLAGMRLAKTTGISLHVQIHTDFRSRYFGRGPLNFVRLIIAKRTLQYAQAVRVVSERIQTSLSPVISIKSAVLPIYADVSAFRSAPIRSDLLRKYPQFKKIALIASRLTKEKDIPTAITAFAEAVKAEPTAGLVIVGSGPEESRLRALANRLNLADKVVFEPWADRATLASYMKSCDAFVSTSLYEGYGLSMLEAHAAGATLVATDAGIAPLLAGEVCRPGDRAAVARMLTAALQGSLKNKPYTYPYPSQEAYAEAYHKDVERALL